MIPRHPEQTIRQALDRQAAVALLGPRQIGKTTIARSIAEESHARYLDLESGEDRAKLSEPALFFRANDSRLVVLDEIHRVPELFQELRGLIDEGRRKGLDTGRYLLLGSASMELMRQTGESLAGRIAYVEMGPLNLLETGDESPDVLWLRGGFPDAFLAVDDMASLMWRRDFVRTYLERDIPMLGPRVPGETIGRLWTMLAHQQGGLLNASRMAAAMMLSPQSIARYLDLLVDLLLVRRLPAFHINVGKRLVKSPKIYIRDSGLTHALLSIPDLDALMGHPIVGVSWEGFVIENILSVVPARTTASFYRTAAGAEIDLVLEIPGHGLWAIEIKRGLAPKAGKGLHQARADLNPALSYVIYSGRDRYPLAEGIDAIGLSDLMQILRSMS